MLQINTQLTIGDILLGSKIKTRMIFEGCYYVHPHFLAKEKGDKGNNVMITAVNVSGSNIPNIPVGSVRLEDGNWYPIHFFEKVD